MTARIDYPTLITFDTATPIGAGQMKADGSDIRVYSDAAHTQALSFYVDNINAADTRLWVKTDHTSGRYHPNITNYYPLDDGVATDLVSGADGTINGTLATVTGQVGDALQFDGSDSNFISTPDSVSTSLAGRSVLTYEAWVKRTSLSTDDRLVQLNGGPSASTRFLIQLNATNAVMVGGRSNNSDSFQSQISTETITDLEWHHIVGILNLATATTVAWLDGVQLTMSGAMTFNQTVFDGSTPISANLLGKASSAGDALNGYLDNVAIYHRAITAAEVRSSYLRGLAGKRLSEPQPAAHWTFSSVDNAGSEVVDLVNGLNGTIAGGVIVGQQGRVGQAFQFNGTDSTVTVPDNALFEPHIGASGTSTWAATVTLDSGMSSTEAIISKYDGASTAREFIVRVDLNQKLDLRLSGTGSDSTVLVIKSDTPVPLGTPVHLTWVFDNTESPNANKINLYLDGVQLSTSVSTDTGFSSIAASLTSDVRIGYEDAIPVEVFSGVMHDLLWSSGVLTNVQISELARRSREGLRPDLTDISLNLLTYWSFDNKDIGTEPQDVIGPNHATAVTAVKVGQQTSVGREAFQFTIANSSEVIVPSDSSMNWGSGDGTVEAWFNTSFDFTSTAGTIFINGADGIGTHRYAISIATSNLLQFQIDDDTALETTFSPSVVNDGNDHHAVGIRDGTDIILYLDGVEVDREPIGSYGNIDEAGVGVQIGSLPLMSSSEQFFEGLIWDVRTYPGTVLTAEQVLDNYEKGRAGVPSSASVSRVYVTYGDPSLSSASSKVNTFIREVTGLVAAYDFDEEDGGDVLDSVGSDDGVVDGYVLVTSGKFGLARKTEGTGAVDFPSQIIPTGTASLVLTFRTKTPTQILAANYDGVATNRGSAVEMEDGYLVYRNTIGSGTDNVFIKGSILINDGVFHTVFVTKTSTEASIYVDGVPDGTDTFVGTETLAATSNFRIGGYSGLFSANATFDDLRVFDEELSASAVSDYDSNFGEVSVNSVLVRTRIDPDPSSRLAQQ